MLSEFTVRETLMLPDPRRNLDEILSDLVRNRLKIPKHLLFHFHVFQYACTAFQHRPTVVSHRVVTFVHDCNCELGSVQRKYIRKITTNYWFSHLIFSFPAISVHAYTCIKPHKPKYMRESGVGEEAGIQRTMSEK